MGLVTAPCLSRKCAVRRYGKPTACDDDVIAAAKMAHLHEAVLRCVALCREQTNRPGITLFREVSACTVHCR